MKERPKRRCCGIDVHKNSVSVCILPTKRTSGPEPARGGVSRHSRADVSATAELAKELRCDGDCDGIERASTGRCWNILEGEFEKLGAGLESAEHIKGLDANTHTVLVHVDAAAPSLWSFFHLLHSSFRSPSEGRQGQRKDIPMRVHRLSGTTVPDSSKLRSDQNHKRAETSNQILVSCFAGDLLPASQTCQVPKFSSVPLTAPKGGLCGGSQK